ncbi:TetR/AcrR family transcriptional regulator [Sphingobium sp. JS3065]|uniref:TetR/AcrR family transcriptional regulator n=1 Tax=Sphingobium sp. JS3065 TaxID=2970925 RepID=UPI002264C5D9|nr:TetR/AcrR family transcriptional regulator [Sphingobium sp. JS3065]UZW54928.1 TetR/AcrR family transcriptional regulator [Sphingobium sp. JS3065]
MVTNSRLRRLSKEDRRTNIIEVAHQVFARDGYGGTSMSGIAAALGGSKATLYKYFDAKEPLFEAVMLECCKGLFADFQSASFNQEDVRTYLIEAGSRLLAAMLKGSALDISRLIFSEGARHPEIARIFYVNGLDPAYAAVAERLAYFHSSGQISCPEPIIAAKQFIALVRGDIHLRAICGLGVPIDHAQLRAHVEQSVSIFLAGVAPGAIGNVINNIHRKAVS